MWARGVGVFVGVLVGVTGGGIGVLAGTTRVGTGVLVGGTKTSVGSGSAFVRGAAAAGLALIDTSASVPAAFEAGTEPVAEGVPLVLGTAASVAVGVGRSAGLLP